MQDATTTGTTISLPNAMDTVRIEQTQNKKGKTETVMDKNCMEFKTSVIVKGHLYPTTLFTILL